MAAVSFSRRLSARALGRRDCLLSPTPSPWSYSHRRWVSLKYLKKVVDADAQWAKRAAAIERGEQKHVLDVLDERGYIKDLIGGSRQQFHDLLLKKRIGVYAGVDPTAPSLHLGHLLAFMPLFWLYLHGYHTHTLIGSATAKIGDPTGRTEDRPALSSSDLIQNLAGIHYQVKELWARIDSAAQRFGYQKEWAWRRGIVNNNAWWNKVPMLDVLRRLGSPTRLGPLLSRDNVKTRLDSGSGMSFAEFCYPLMQGWDWYEMFLRSGCQMQIGGSDQYGNILTGIGCVKNCLASEPDPNKKVSIEESRMVGLTVPLLTDSSGAKFGKSAGNAIWLDPFKTSPFDLYGYLCRRPDDQVEKLLKLFTFHDMQQISEVMETHRADPSKRVAQHLLAFDVTWLAHGTDVANKTQQEHRERYERKSLSGVLSGVLDSAESLQSASHYEYRENRAGGVSHDNRPRADMKLPRSLLQESLTRIVYAAGLSSSSSDAHRLIAAGGVYVGGAPGKNPKMPKQMNPERLQWVPLKTWRKEMTSQFLVDNEIMILRKGKHNLRVIKFISDEEWEESGMEHPGQKHTGAFRKTVQEIKRLSTILHEGEGDGDTARQLRQAMASIKPSSDAQYGFANRALRYIKDLDQHARAKKAEAGTSDPEAPKPDNKSM